jgi:hypothetical protein
VRSSSPVATPLNSGNINSGNIARTNAVGDPGSHYAHIQQAARNMSLGMSQSSPNAMPMTPDAASRLASLSAARVGQNQVASLAPMMARAAAGSLQEYGTARPQFSRPS